MINYTNFTNKFPIVQETDMHQNVKSTIKVEDVLKDSKEYTVITDKNPKSILDSEIRKKRIFTAIAAVGLILAVAALTAGLIMLSGGTGLFLLLGLAEVVSLGLFIFGVVKAIDHEDKAEALRPVCNKISKIQEKIEYLKTKSTQPESARYNEMFQQAKVPANIVTAFNELITEKNRTAPVRNFIQPQDVVKARNKRNAHLKQYVEAKDRLFANIRENERVLTAMSKLNQIEWSAKATYLSLQQKLTQIKQEMSISNETYLARKVITKLHTKRFNRLEAVAKAEHEKIIASDKTAIDQKNEIYKKINFDFLAARIAVDYASITPSS